MLLTCLAVVGAAALSIAWQRGSRALFTGIAVTALLALASAIPVLSPGNITTNLLAGKITPGGNWRMKAWSLEAKPKVYSRWIELGNILIQRGKREEAVRAYQNARLYAPEGDQIIVPLSQQMQRVSQEDLKSLPPLQNSELGSGTVRRLRQSVEELDAFAGVLVPVFERDYKKGEWNFEGRETAGRGGRPATTQANLEYQKKAEERDELERPRGYFDAIEKLSPFTSHGNERTSSEKV